MKVICETAISQEADIRQAAVECLVSIASSTRLRGSAAETLSEVIRCANIAEDTNLIAELLIEMLKRIGRTMEAEIMPSEKQRELQALLCGIQVIIQTLNGCEESKPVILQSADQMMAMFLRVFAWQSLTVHEEAMRAVGALACATGPNFAKYMPEFYEYLETGLQNHEENQVCSISAGVVGDICRALGDQILKYCDGIMRVLLQDLYGKPAIFSCFGDIARAVGSHFERYFPYAVAKLQKAAQVSAKLDSSADEDVVDYVNRLRKGIFEAYSGILQGFKDDRAELMMPYAGHLLQYTEAVFTDKKRGEGVTKAAVAMMGDLTDTLGPNLRTLLTGCTFHTDFLGECFQSDDDQLKETATWTQGKIYRVLES
ncbi:hypothetical protein LUZ60_010270 [Juncus effusus]|nr:hypothetical protein LUZ60_010270 [Juncus effusus]